jgi:hypothetical protein
MREADFAEEFADSSNALPSFEEGLEGDTLMSYNLEAFENRAKQKLEDWAGYVEILTDSTVDQSFKEQARVMAEALFETSETKIFLDVQGNITEKPLPLDKYLRRLMENSTGKITITPREIIVNQHLTRLSNSVYRGVFQLNGMSSDNDIKLNINFAVKQIEKEFGGTTKKVWEVFLGDIQGS